jgi:hypothetical protein
MKRSLLPLVAAALFWMAPVWTVRGQPAKTPVPPQVWGPHLPGKEHEETNPCVKKCNAEFERELKICFALASSARSECERPLRERHRDCYTRCPK